ncbi:MAG: Asp-tRNA(Asn)/Glu-tRNA(Gln) amidotransferase subunit GatA [bacterium]
MKNLTIEKAHDSLKAGEYTVLDLANAYLKVIKEKNSELNVYLEVYVDVMAQAERAQAMFTDGSATLMTGIPVALKDNMLFEGHVASASSKILENYKATYDAGVVAQLKSQGAVFLGRTNMDEFAMGSSTESSAYGITRNPINPDYVPGGSSGGSAAAVAMNGALVSLGSDTGGSIREPASFCGIVGLKTTYGTVSRSGIISMGSSLDQVGPMTKTVADAEILFNVINAYDAMDSTSVPTGKRVSTTTTLKKRIGVPRAFVSTEGVNQEVLKNFEESCEKLKNAGYEIVDVSLSLLKYSLPAYYIIMPAEVSSNLARYDGIRYGLSSEGDKLFDVYAKTRGAGFGKEVRRRILLGAYVLSHGYYDAYYNKAVKVRDAIRNELQEVFKEVDAIITPTVPTLPWKFGEMSKDPVSMYLADIYTVGANIAGVPAISVPSGFSESGLPIGLQITAPHFAENTLFTIGKDFEKLV